MGLNRSRNYIQFIFILGVFCFHVLAEDPIKFEDEDLKTLVEQKLGIKNPTATDMLLLKELIINDASAPNLYVMNINDLRYAKNLETISMLVTMSQDISILAELKKLKTIYFKGRVFGEFQDYNKIENLESLTLEKGYTSVVPAVKTLKYLNLNHNSIRDINELCQCPNIKELYLIDNGISDISVLAKLNDLEVLWLESNKIRDISPLLNLKKLRVVALRNNSLNQKAYSQHLKQIIASNPNLEEIKYDCNPLVTYLMAIAVFLITSILIVWKYKKQLFFIYILVMAIACAVIGAFLGGFSEILYAMEIDRYSMTIDARNLGWLPGMYSGFFIAIFYSILLWRIRKNRRVFVHGCLLGICAGLVSSAVVHLRMFAYYGKFHLILASVSGVVAGIIVGLISSAIFIGCFCKNEKALAGDCDE